MTLPSTFLSRYVRITKLAQKNQILRTVTLPSGFLSILSQGRSRAEKVGRLKYDQQLLKRALRDLEEVKLMQRTILAGLKGMFHFEKPVIQEIACVDEVDVLILDYLYEDGNADMLPKDLAAKLAEFRIRRHQVSRRIIRMNKRLEEEIGEKLVEKRGWHWDLTFFRSNSGEILRSI